MVVAVVVVEVAVAAVSAGVGAGGARARGKATHAMGPHACATKTPRDLKRSESGERVLSDVPKPKYPKARTTEHSRTARAPRAALPPCPHLSHR
jgi:hypothetical protein